MGWDWVVGGLRSLGDGSSYTTCQTGRGVCHVTSSLADLTAFLSLDRLGLRALWQQLNEQPTVIGCAVIELYPWCFARGGRGSVTPTTTTSEYCSTAAAHTPTPDSNTKNRFESPRKGSMAQPSFRGRRPRSRKVNNPESTRSERRERRVRSVRCSRSNRGVG